MIPLTAALVPMLGLWLGTARADDAPVLAQDEVSVGAYEQFVAAGGYTDPEHWSEAGWAWVQQHPDGAGASVRASGRPENHPVVAVTRHEAEAYCAWAGMVLPDAASWQHSACWNPETQAWAGRWPWGDDEDFGANWYQGGKSAAVTGVPTQPVDQQDASLAGPGGQRHLAGNVWEWTRGPWMGQQDSPWGEVRGGSYQNLPSYCTCEHAEPVRPDTWRLTIGFRCAQVTP